MELKWLEDFLSVVEWGHFAKAAQERGITQSAFSRRIQSLEAWLGEELVDRAVHPVRPTAAGEEFLPVARQVVRLSNEARSAVLERQRVGQQGVTIACLHTLALAFVPQLVSKLQEEVGSFATNVVAETRRIEDYLAGLLNGASDIFIGFRHPVFRFSAHTDRLQRIDLGHDRLLPYGHRDRLPVALDREEGEDIPFLDYGGSSYLSLIVSELRSRAPFSSRLRPVYRATLAESLAQAALDGLGIAWLPESIATRHAALACIGQQWGERVEISAFRDRANRRPIVEALWQAMEAGARVAQQADAS